jgi:hypothetical protein
MTGMNAPGSAAAERILPVIKSDHNPARCIEVRRHPLAANVLGLCLAVSAPRKDRLRAGRAASPWPAESVGAFPVTREVSAALAMTNEPALGRFSPCHHAVSAFLLTSS